MFTFALDLTTHSLLFKTRFYIDSQENTGTYGTVQI